MAALKTLTDEQLVRRTLAGEQDAFGVLIERHFHSVRAVALAYASRKDDADDLVQEACVKAYRSLDALRDGARFLPWLIKSLIRLAKDAYRRESRRAALAERAPEAPEASTPAPEREEMREIVRRELAKLDENHRVVLLLRYYGGRDVRAIGDALDITPDAAAKRLQRAREALGERLLDFIDRPEPAEDSGKRIPSIMGAVAATKPPWAGTAAGTSTATIAGGTSSAPTLAIGAASVVLAAIIGVTLWRMADTGTAFAPAVETQRVVAPLQSSEMDSQRDSAANAERKQPEDDDTDQADILLAADESAAENQATDSGATLIVRVFDAETGTGVANADVRVIPRPELENFDRTTVHTNTAGHATLTNLPPGTYEVALWSAPAFDVEAYLEREVISVNGPQDAISVEFGLSSGLSVSGVVVDERGRPIPEAEVGGHIEGANISSDTKAGYNGAFVLYGLAETGDFIVQPTKEGYALGPQGPMTIPANGLDGVVLTMYPAAAVSGFLVDQNGDPLPGYRVHAGAVRRISSYTRGIRGTETSADGSFTVTGLWPGKFRFMVGRPRTGSYRTVPDADTFEVEAGEHLTGVIVKYEQEPTTFVAGRVVDTNGEPIRWVEVTGDYAWGTWRDYTDSTGRFRIEHLEDRMHTLYFWHNNYTSEDLKKVTAGRDDIEVILEARGAIAGTVIDKTTGDPIREFSVLEQSRKRPAAIDDVTIQFGNPDGEFLVPNVQKGTRRIYVSAPGYRSVSLKDIVVRPGETSDGLLVELMPSPVIAGVVLDSSGVAVAEAFVFQKDEKPTFEGAAVTARYAHPAGRQFYETTGSDGRFRIASLAAGARYVVAFHRVHGYGYATIDPESDENQELELRLRPIPVVEGYVLRDDEPVVGMQVEVQGQHHTTTDETGHYRLVVPLDKPFDVNVWGDDRSLTAHDVTVPPGESTRIDFDLTPGDTTITGRVTLGGRTPDPDLRIRVNLFYEFGGNREVRLDAYCEPDGTYRIEGAMPGRARVWVPASWEGDHTTVSQLEHEVVIDDVSEFLLDFDLEQPAATQSSR